MNDNDDNNQKSNLGPAGEAGGSAGGAGQIIGGDPNDQWEFPVGGIPQKDIDEIIAYPIPAHNNELDEKEFKELLARSVSLTQKEKIKIIDSLPKLSPYQVKELVRILREEKQKFAELEEKQKKQLEEFEQNRAKADEERDRMQVQEEDKKSEDKAKEEELRRRLGL